MIKPWTKSHEATTWIWSPFLGAGCVNQNEALYNMGGGNGQKAATARARNQAKTDAEKARESSCPKSETSIIDQSSMRFARVVEAARTGEKPSILGVDFMVSLRLCLKRCSTQDSKATSQDGLEVCLNFEDWSNLEHRCWRRHVLLLRAPTWTSAEALSACSASQPHRWKQLRHDYAAMQLCFGKMFAKIKVFGGKSGQTERLKDWNCQNVRVKKEKGTSLPTWLKKFENMCLSALHAFRPTPSRSTPNRTLPRVFPWQSESTLSTSQNIRLFDSFWLRFCFHDRAFHLGFRRSWTYLDLRHWSAVEKPQSRSLLLIAPAEFIFGRIQFSVLRDLFRKDYTRLLFLGFDNKMRKHDFLRIEISKPYTKFAQSLGSSQCAMR